MTINKKNRIEKLKEKARNDPNSKIYRNYLKKLEEDKKLRKLIDENDIVQEIKKIFPGSKIAKSSFH